MISESKPWCLLLLLGVGRQGTVFPGHWSKRVQESVLDPIVMLLRSQDTAGWEWKKGNQPKRMLDVKASLDVYVVLVSPKSERISAME